MNLTSRLEGYLNNEIAYSQPIPNLPVPKTLDDKKDTTLLQMAMKAFLKQRLYGRFQIFDKDNTQNKNHLKNRSNSIDNGSLINQQQNQSSRSNSKNFFKRDKKRSILDPVNTEYHSKEKTSGLSNINHMNEKRKSFFEKRRPSQISSSFDFKPNKLEQGGRLLESHRNLKQTGINSLNKSFHLKKQNIPKQIHAQEYTGTHFISAIDYYEGQNEKEQNILQKSHLKINQKQHLGIRLPEITDKRNKNFSMLQNTKNAKICGKKQTQPQGLISQQLWSFISQNKTQKTRRLRQVKQTQNTSIITSVLKSSEIKDISIIKSPQTSLINKQAFQNFISDSKLSIPFFLQNLLNFFQLSNKSYDKCKKTDFEYTFSTVFNLPDRAWSVAAFRFLDMNADGKISSSDLFKLHNLLEEILENIQLAKQQNLSNLKKVNERKNSNQITEIKQKSNNRQKTHASQNGSVKSQKRSKIFIKQTIQNSVKQKTDESQRLSEENFLILSNLIEKNLENVKKLQSEIQKLNSNILKNQRLANRNSRLDNPQKQQQTNDLKLSRGDQQAVYLEEALLQNKELKISDLHLILQELSTKNNKTKKKVIDIDYRKMNIKLSSSYVQTFIATNHNEETRLNREYLQSLKDMNRKEITKYNNLNSGQQRKSPPAIRYPQFYENKLFSPLKDSFFQCIHFDTIDQK